MVYSAIILALFTHCRRQLQNQKTLLLAGVARTQNSYWTSGTAMASGPAASAATRRSGAGLQTPLQSCFSQAAGHPEGDVVLTSWRQLPVHLPVCDTSVRHHCRQQADGFDSSDSDGSIDAVNSAAELEEAPATHPPRTQAKTCMRLYAAERSWFEQATCKTPSCPMTARCSTAAPHPGAACCRAGHLCQPHALAAEPVCGGAPPHALRPQHRLRGPGLPQGTFLAAFSLQTHTSNVAKAEHGIWADAADDICRPGLSER